jgi:hypothetical protein
VEKTKKQVSFYAKRNEIKNYFSVMPMILLVHKEVYFNIDKHDHYILNVFVFLLQDYKDNFTNVIPNGLPPIREIKHQINLVPGATILN